jgi:hypothetical protein
VQPAGHTLTGNVPVTVLEVEEPKQRERPRPAHRDVPLSLLALAIPVAVLLARLLIAMPRPFISGGDTGFIELGIRKALRGRATLGPYSRFGWFHPGPALYYLFAPVYALAGSRSRALFLDAWLLNGGCALWVVLLIRRRLGEVAARLTSALVGVWMVAVGFAEFLNPWNPSLLALPLLFMLFLAADAAAGSVWSLVLAFLVGSYLVQTHLAVLPLVGVVLGATLLAWGQGARGRLKVHARPLLVGVVGVAVLWAGPVVQQFTNSPGNLGEIASFFRHPPAAAGTGGHGIRAAAGAVTAHATVMPLGRPADLGLHGGRLALATVVALLGVGVAVLAWRRSRFLAWLAALTPLSLAIAVAATTRVVNDLLPYLFFWTAPLILPALVAAGAWFFTRASNAPPGPRNHRRRAVAVGTGIAVVLTMAAATRAAIRQPTATFFASPDAVPTARLIERRVGPRTQVFTLQADGHFEVAAVFLQLERDGYRFRVLPPFDTVMTDAGRRRATIPLLVTLRTASPANVPLAGEHFGTVGELEVWADHRPGEIVGG